VLEGMVISRRNAGSPRAETGVHDKKSPRFYRARWECLRLNAALMSD